MKISVAFAMPDRQTVLELEVSAGATVAEALEQSGIVSTVPGAAQMAVGIYGKITSRETVLQPGDRIEIYRPLTEEPKEARRRRVIKS